jgi:predicted O-linked N-acetylglucosamine transferase (SPINDLY family)
MTKGNRDYDKELKRVDQAFVEDILARSDSEIIAEVAEDANPSIVLAHVRDLVRRALDASSKAKMAAARAAMKQTPRKPPAIIALPLSQKKEILRRLVAKSSALPRQITLAARNEDEMSESDLDGILENLRDLGVIDEQGNPK